MFELNKGSSVQDTVTSIQEPLAIDTLHDIAWSDTANVVVVGWGMAGACAALEARAQGMAK